MPKIITFQKSNYTDAGYFYRCSNNHFDDFSNEYVLQDEYQQLENKYAELFKLVERLDNIGGGIADLIWDDSSQFITLHSVRIV